MHTVADSKVTGPTGYQASLVLAVVDATIDLIIVWWVRIAPLAQMNSRLVGAWMLPYSDVDDLRNVIARRIGVPTPAGVNALNHLGLTFDVTLDLLRTEAAVQQAHTDLRDAFATQVAARVKGQRLITPAWPTLPPPISLNRPVTGTEVPQANTLAIARDFTRFVGAWDHLERIRLSHPKLHGDPVSAHLTAQPLPYILEGT